MLLTDVEARWVVCAAESSTETAGLLPNDVDTVALVTVADIEPAVVSAGERTVYSPPVDDVNTSLGSDTVAGSIEGAVDDFKVDSAARDTETVPTDVGVAVAVVSNDALQG